MKYTVGEEYTHLDQLVKIIELRGRFDGRTLKTAEPLDGYEEYVTDREALVETRAGELSVTTLDKLLAKRETLRATTRFIQRAGINFDVYSKSIRVNSQHGTVMIFYGRELEDKDIDALCMLIDMGAAMQAGRLRAALASTSLFGDSR